MIPFVQFLLALLIICPILAFIIVLFVCRRLRMVKHKAIGLAADVTTCILFLSIPIAVRGLWELSIFIPTVMFALVVAIIFTYIEWRTKKEIEVKPLLRKIWRIYFLLLSIVYCIIWAVGLTHSIFLFMMVD